MRNVADKTAQSRLFDIPYIRAVDKHLTFGYVEKAGHKIYKRGFAASRRTDKRDSLTFFGFKAYILYYLFVGVGIFERYVFKLNRSLFCKRLFLFGVGDGKRGFKHFVYALCRHLRPGQKHEHHHKHNKRHNYLRSELHKCDNSGIFYRSAVDQRRAHPINSKRHAVHNKHHNGRHKRHKPAREQLGFRNCRIGFFKLFGLITFGIVRADYADTRKIFTRYTVKPVDKLLNNFKLWHNENNKHG